MNSSLSSNNRFSNECMMIYMDIYPGVPGTQAFNNTLAHELQHLMNFATTFQYRSEITNNVITKIFPTDLWINEGLSESAEWVYSGEVSQGRVNWYNNDSTHTIRKGDNFFIWGNNPGALANEYATVNLFFQWLRLQEGENIYGKISTSGFPDYRAVTNSLGTPAVTQAAWAGLLEEWHIANYLNNSTGRYGYKNDPVLKHVKANYYPANDLTVELLPGEAVYSYSEAGMPSLPVLNSGTNIRYHGLTSSSSVPAGGALLTHNVDTVFTELNGKFYGAETEGRLTGETPPIMASIQASFQFEPSGPYRIDAGDILRQNGKERNYFEEGIK